MELSIAVQEYTSERSEDEETIIDEQEKGRILPYLGSNGKNDKSTQTEGVSAVEQNTVKDLMVHKLLNHSVIHGERKFLIQLASETEMIQRWVNEAYVIQEHGEKLKEYLRELSRKSPRRMAYMKKRLPQFCEGIEV